MRDMNKKRKRDREDQRRLRQAAKGPAPDEKVDIAEVRPMRLLVIDIETMANLGWHWDVWQQNIAPAQIVQHKRTISFAAKWVGEAETAFVSEYHDTREIMVADAHRLLSVADGVIGYNSKRFDTRHLNTEFVVEGYGPPAPFAHIDLLNTVKQNFLFGSNKLEAVIGRLGLGHKLEHEGFKLWSKCACHDPRVRAFYPDITNEVIDNAWTLMRDYNIHDVLRTEDLYRKILPWITNHPSYSAFAESDKPICSNCGTDLNPLGFHYARTRRYERYLCPKCGHWNRSRKAITVTQTTETSSY